MRTSFVLVVYFRFEVDNLFCWKLKPFQARLCPSGTQVYVLLTISTLYLGIVIVPCAIAKAGDIKTHSSVCHKNFYLAQFFRSIIMIEHWYLACKILVTGHFHWQHALTFDVLHGQICCHAWHHMSLNFFVPYEQLLGDVSFEMCVVNMPASFTRCNQVCKFYIQPS